MMLGKLLFRHVPSIRVSVNVVGKQKVGFQLCSGVSSTGVFESKQLWSRKVHVSHRNNCSFVRIRGT